MHPPALPIIALALSRMLRFLASIAGERARAFLVARPLFQLGWAAAIALLVAITALHHFGEHATARGLGPAAQTGISLMLVWSVLRLLRGVMRP